MGADIHIVIEKRWRGKWVGVRTDYGLSADSYIPDVNNKSVWPAVGRRDYNFFARLAGVRGVGPAPNGVPPDASDMAQMHIEHWGMDGHSHSHLPLREFAIRWCADNQEFMARLTAEQLAGDDSSYTTLLYAASIQMCDDPDDADEYRVVFWFDN
jgi:hypothetical protein